MNSDYDRVSVILYKDQSGIKLPYTYTRKFKRSGMTLVFNSVHKILGIRKASMALLYFLGEQMDVDTNEVTSNKQLRMKFQNHLVKMGVKPLKDATYHKAIQELVGKDLLIKTPTRSLYIVNPRHIHKTTNQKRKKLLETLMKKIDSDEWQGTNLVQALGELD